MVVSTYQAASGAGAAAMEELELQTREVSLLYSLFSAPVYLDTSLHYRFNISFWFVGIGRQRTYL